jgi:hypothetical protein
MREKDNQRNRAPLLLAHFTAQPRIRHHLREAKPSIRVGVLEISPVGPPASNIQYQQAKTRVLRIHSAPAEISNSGGDSLCFGKREISSKREAMVETVTTAFAA